MPDKPFFQNGLFDNLHIKVAALFLAITTWYVVHQTINLEINVDNVPVNVLLDAGWAIQEQSSDSVDIRFRGSQEDILYLRPETIKVIVDSRAAKVGGSQTVIFTAKNVKVPGSARPISFRPDSMTFKIDKESEKSVPVRIELQEEPPLGFAVASSNVQPREVKIIGPLQRLDEVQEVRTMPLSLLGRKEPFKALLALVVPDATWEPKIRPEKVNVEVTIVERSSNLELTNVPVNVLSGPVRNAAEPILEPSQVRVTLKGRSEVLEAFDAAGIQAYVDCRNLPATGATQLTVVVHVDEPLTVEKVEPAAIQVRTSN